MSRVAALLLLGFTIATSLANTATVRVPLIAKDGSHHIQVYVGEPPVPVTLTVDTGSRLTAWNGAQCAICWKNRRRRRKTREGEIRLYDPIQSSTSSVTLQQSTTCTSDNDCHFIDASTCEPTIPRISDRPQQTQQCTLKQHYTEGSAWSAYEVTDVVTLAGSRLYGNSNGTAAATASIGESSRVDADYEESLFIATSLATFGVHTTVSGLFAQQYADGILGLEHSSFSFLSSFGESSGIFSLCLATSGGSLGLNGALTEHHRVPMRYTPMVPPEERQRQQAKAAGLYAITVERVELGDVCLTCIDIASKNGTSARGTNKKLLRSFRDTILDSGTTDTYLPKRLYSVFAAAWKKETNGRRYSNEVEIYSRGISSLPTLTIVLANNVSLAIPPEQYMEAEQQPRSKSLLRSKRWTNRIYVNEAQGAVLGINAMLGHDVLLDWENQRIGIAPADCELS